ncbi:hypothetical protein RchiOBHm_Chr3g0494491 [Rosa chinensis]|uniref:Uncharacterized protein n=1 Tax=Rosa chinensis TaxID=74649 RepID=A0A2P6RH02_ROSCH|nr:hypothetical protein RchiOBHm_Chr3g0494491 [Rosa chinensis]
MAGNDGDVWVPRAEDVEKVEIPEYGIFKLFWICRFCALAYFRFSVYCILVLQIARVVV